MVKPMPDYQIIGIWILNGPQEDVVDKTNSLPGPRAPFGQDDPVGAYEPE
jgi:hypothetical protein